jgi:hypothetical protein
MPVWNFCFVVGAVAALIGMGLGMAMGIGQDFTLTPVHAHINLLGWVSMMLFGLYYRGAGHGAGRLAWVQAGMASAGFVLMTGGLFLYLSGISDMVGKPLTIAGSLLVVGSMLLFLLILIRARQRLKAERRAVAAFGRSHHISRHAPPISASTGRNFVL